MVQEVEVTEVDIDGRSFMVRPVGSWVLESGNVVAEALAVSLDKPLEWAAGFLFGNTELSLELWNVIAGVRGSMIRISDLWLISILSFHRYSLKGFYVVIIEVR